MQGVEGFWSVLAQLPVVAAFIWFVLEMLKRFERIQEQQNEVLLEMSRALEQMQRAFVEHDARVRTLLGERWDGGGS